MHRRHCRQCAGIFAIIAIAIVALVARCQAGVVIIIIVIVDVDVRRHRRLRCILSIRRHRRRLCRPPPVARRAIAIVMGTLTTNPPTGVPTVHFVQFWYGTLKMTIPELAEPGTGNGTTRIESSSGTGP